MGYSIVYSICIWTYTIASIIASVGTSSQHEASGHQSTPPKHTNTQSMGQGPTKVGTEPAARTGFVSTARQSQRTTSPDFVPATITTPPRDLTVLPARSAIFDCHVHGDPFPEIFWTVGGVPLLFDRGRLSVKHLARGIVLKISEVDGATDNGLVVGCVADNGLGPTDMAEAVLHVLHTDIPDGFPTHSTEQSKLVAVSDTVQLRCPIGGQLPMVFGWYKDLVPLELASLNMDHHGGITIRNASVSDSGIYLCSAENEYGTAFSEGTGLFVGITPEITYVPHDHKTKNRSHVTFFCQSEGLPRPKLYWKAKGARVTKGSHPAYQVHKTENGTRLSIGRTNYARDHGVDFECIARNDLGSASASARLEIYSDEDVPDCFPKITTSPRFRAVWPEGSVTLGCSAEGAPPPRVAWLRDGIPLDRDNPRYTLSHTGSLHISPVRQQDEGFYVCSAENSVGITYSESTYFYVIEAGSAPRIVSLPDDTVATGPEDNTHLTCVAVGDPMPYVTWATSSRHVTNSMQIPVGVATVEMAPSAGTREYVCHAHSTAGTASRHITVLPVGHSIE